MGDGMAGPCAAAEDGAAILLPGFPRAFGVRSGLEFTSGWLLGDYFPRSGVGRTLVPSPKLLK